MTEQEEKALLASEVAAFSLEREAIEAQRIAAYYAGDAASKTHLAQELRSALYHWRQQITNGQSQDDK